MTASGRAWLAEIAEVDEAVYAAVAGVATPQLDRMMRRVSVWANYSRISMAEGAVLAAVGRSRGRRAAVAGLASVAVSSAVVNLVVKPLGGRARPDRADGGASRRTIRMPGSRSFPSGHTASAVAFASGAGREFPAASLPLHALAALVAYSRVHNGVHYPADVVVGAVIGSSVADAVGAMLARRRS